MRLAVRVLLDAELAALAKVCPGLTDIDLEGCGNVTEAGVLALEAAYPGLRINSDFDQDSDQ